VQGFILPDEIPIDAEETLNQLTSRFRGVRDGLPELVKNSKDQYSRLGITEEADRQIVVIADTHRRSLAVVDFAGAPANNFDGWTNWSDPNAGQAGLAADIEAGHGNGGKAFMVRGASRTAFLESCYLRKRTRKGFVNDRPGELYKPGFATFDGVKLDNIEDHDPAGRLQEALSLVGMRIELLPQQAQKIFGKRKAFTIAYLEQVKDWIGRRAPKLKKLAGSELAENIASHGQTAMTIETCQVWVIRDGEVIGSGPVTPAEIPPYPGFEVPREFTIPDLLPDPETGEAIRIFDEPGECGYLRLKTSQNQLQISPTTRAKNVIRIWNQRNNVATWTPQELHGVSAASFIYGELRCSSLTEDHMDGATRQHLADTPLVRALREWATEHVRQLADDLHRAMAENTTPSDRKRARSALSSIRELMRKYLDPDSSGAGSENGAEGAHSGASGKGQTEKRKQFEYGSELHEIILEPNLRDVTLIAGTRIPILYRCLERQADGATKPVRAPNLLLKSEPEGMFTLDADGMLTSHTTGLGEIWLETPDGGIQSNRREFWTIEATGVDLEFPDRALLQGQRLSLKFTFQTPDGPLDDALIDGEVLDPSFGAIGRNGRLTVGQKEGYAEIRIRFGASSMAYRDFSIPVGPDKVPPKEGSGDSGGDVPEILLCGEHAPGMEEYPPERRTIPGGPEYPTIVEDPLFVGIVWINPNSKEAMRVRRSAGGSSGLGKIGNKTFMHFVALKCFDILKRLYVRQQIAGDFVSEFTYMQYAAYAEMECADFIDAAWEMTDQLLARDGSANEQ
jgi:hypothetical protein